ncbi:MAG: hypothetical protein AAF585_05560 [Verrucomicrobiota bacterium]
MLRRCRIEPGAKRLWSRHSDRAVPYVVDFGIYLGFRNLFEETLLVPLCGLLRLKEKAEHHSQRRKTPPITGIFQVAARLSADETSAQVTIPAIPNTAKKMKTVVPRATSMRQPKHENLD